MSSDSSSTSVPKLPPAPQGMVEWSSTAARLQRAVSRAYPNRAPEEVEALVDRLWKHALRGATLAGVLDAHARAFARLAETAGGFSAKVEQQIEAAESRQQADLLRADLNRYQEALRADLLAGRDRIAAEVQEAHDSARAFAEAARALAERLRDEPECRELLASND